MAPVVNQDPAFLLERFAALPAAEPLVGRLAAAPLDVFLVGGAIRDLMLGLEPLELDLVVEGELEPVVEQLGAVSRLYDRFGTATVELGGFIYDLARARRESYSHPGALPSVAAASLEHDLGRRDFTVNAIALAVLGPRRGSLAAFGPALADLRAGTMRVLHDGSFSDDPTRLLRLARYASRLGFAIEPHTRELAEAAVAADALGMVSGSRLGAELRLVAGETDAVAALSALGELGIGAALAPGFGLRDPELARRALSLLPADGDSAALAIAAASMRVAPAELAQMLERLAFEARERDSILAAAREAGRLAASLEAAALPSEVAAAVRGSRLEAVALAGALGPAEAARSWLEELRFVRLEIDGRDLLEAGVASGPAVGEGLRAALGSKLDGRAVGRDAELAEALRAASARG
jgi:tRNA nucleotidyltransferase (CCA-adding enzyme)